VRVVAIPKTEDVKQKFLNGDIFELTKDDFYSIELC
jgi:hypothetical protein